MIATVSTALLADALTRVIPAVSEKSTLYVLEHVLLTADGDRIELMTTDTELMIKTAVAANVTTAGTALVPARKLHKIIKELPDNETCVISAIDNQLHIMTASGRYVLPVLVDELPKPPDVEPSASITIPQACAHTIAKCVPYAASTNIYHSNLMGVYIELGDELIAVATDTYRLALVAAPIASDSHMHAILPAHAVEQLAKVDSDVMLSISVTHATITTVTEQITTRLLVEQYPDWRSVMPDNCSITAHVDRDTLLDALRRVALFAGEDDQRVRFEWAINTLTLSATDMLVGAHAEETIECDYNGEPFVIAFARKLIMEALTHMPAKRVQLAFSRPDRAALITPADEQELRIAALVMPMRL
jgi:DNA polymerase-3 subunit beta